jgi:probable rRNA maturation factor
MIEVEVEDAAWAAAVEDVEAVATRAAQAALGVAVGGVTILLSDDETVRDLNGRFRGKTQPTNVLSFPAAAVPNADVQPLGDIVLGYGVCAEEARVQGKRLSDHLAHLTVHGVLHLLGRDHEDDAEAEAMEAEEREILAGLGVADPYRTDT